MLATIQTILSMAPSIVTITEYISFVLAESAATTPIHGSVKCPVTAK